MSAIATKGGTQIYVEDWGPEPPAVFGRGWPAGAGTSRTGDSFCLRGYR